jgi:formate dehydrogenase
MTVLSLVRNYLPSHQFAAEGGWNIADCVSRSYDLEGMQFGTIAAGRIGLAVLRRLKPFDVKLHYYNPHRLGPMSRLSWGSPTMIRLSRSSKSAMS